MLDIGSMFVVSGPAARVLARDKFEVKGRLP
jgi:hypothetical protein